VVEAVRRAEPRRDDAEGVRDPLGHARATAARLAAAAEIKPSAITPFRRELAAAGVGRVSIHKAMTLLQGVVQRALERIAEARGKTPHDVVAELLRDADRPAA
jgi:hypothetical protein